MKIVEISKSDLDGLINVTLDFINDKIDCEDNIYSKAVLQRMMSSLNSSQVLVDNGCWLDVPVLMRVVFDHSCRLYQYRKDPDTILKSHPKAFKMLGKSPGPIFTIHALGNELGDIYELLCSFTHADITSLVIAQSEMSNNIDTIKMVINISLYGVYYILLEAYEAISEESEVILKYLTSFNNIMAFGVDDLFDNREKIEEVINIVEKMDFFAKDHLNNSIKDIMNLALDDRVGAKEKIMHLLLRKDK